MKTRDKIRAWIERLREKHKLTYMDDSTYHEKWSVNVSTLSLLSLIFVYSLFLIVIVMLLIRFTAFGGYVEPGDDSETAAIIEEQTHILDSLSRLTESNEKYLRDLKTLLRDEPFNDSALMQKKDTVYRNYVPDFSKSPEDSALRYKIENESKQVGAKENSISVDFFFPPVNGQVSQSFNSTRSHFGVDVVTAADEPIKACLDGTVIASGWIPGEGNILIIQHHNEFVSVYKHCSVLLKKQGDNVLTGDPVGIVGNTGEFTSGPHLHFEIWQKGNAINPQEFISF